MDAHAETRDWRRALVWWAIIVALIAFWAVVGWSLSRAFAAPPPPAVHCTESARGPHGPLFDTGTAIVCTR